MKRLLINLCIGFLCICGFAKEFQVPVLTNRIVDTTNTLSKKDLEYLENLIKVFEENTKGQFVVCIVNTLEGLSIEQASMKIAEKWKIGYKGKDNGILFLLAMKEREFRIEIGYGFEGKLNDGKCGEIARTLIIPAFKENQWSKGIGLTIQKCDYYISGKTTEELKEAETKKVSGLTVWLILIGVVLLFIFIMILDIESSDGGPRFFFGGGGGSSGGGFSGGGGHFSGGGFSGKF